MPSRYSIRDLERISGIKAHTLRIWEQRYKILAPERTDTNIRYYSDADLRRILNISLLNNNGYKISAISKLSDKELLQEVKGFLDAYSSESDQVENLMLCLMDLDEARFESVINNSIAHFGFENTMEKVVFPFLKHLGDLWQVGIVSAAQEHYISNLIRQKLIAGIDRLEPPHTAHPRNWLLFLPNSELHELGLLYAHYLLRARGHKCVYLGQSVPLDDLTAIAVKVQPDVMLTIFTTALPDTDLDSYLSACSRQLPKVPFLFSGRLFFHSSSKPALPSPLFTLFESFEELKKLM